MYTAFKESASFLLQASKAESRMSRGTTLKRGSFFSPKTSISSSLLLFGSAFAFLSKRNERSFWRSCEDSSTKRRNISFISSSPPLLSKTVSILVSLETMLIASENEISKGFFSLSSNTSLKTLSASFRAILTFFFSQSSSSSSSTASSRPLFPSLSLSLSRSLSPSLSLSLSLSSFCIFKHTALTSFQYRFSLSDDDPTALYLSSSLRSVFIQSQSGKSFSLSYARGSLLFSLSRFFSFAINVSRPSRTISRKSERKRSRRLSLSSASVRARSSMSLCLVLGSTESHLGSPPMSLSSPLSVVLPVSSLRSSASLRRDVKASRPSFLLFDCSIRTSSATTRAYLLKSAFLRSGGKA
mmetsp:Transcript_4375/g.8834  ORF Transcript_4375/g.8834 Transcript_4375/m.8834 type:complete len:356 (+) Transcript_4375:468-1535(+)